MKPTIQEQLNLRDRKAPSEEEKERTQWLRLCRIAQDRKYDVGWATHAFYTQFKHWPNALWIRWARELREQLDGGKQP